MIYVRLTNGFGNNLFQCNAARLLAMHHKVDYCAIAPTKDYYGTEPLRSLGINVVGESPILSNAHRVVDTNYIDAFNKKYKSSDILLIGYFEDYRYYHKTRNKIKSWYPEVEETNQKDLVVHFRTGDRLFFKNEFHLRPRADRYAEAISQFDFENLHIVTDMPVWEHITVEDLRAMKFHSSVPKEQSVSLEESVDFFNSFVDGFQQFSPIVQNRSLIEDFNFMRGFKNILFEHGTMSWWAAFLGDPKKVGVYGPWRSWKGKSNKNLSQIPLDGWFKWK